jgi:NitT/TauT family transport system substrate-binding protein
MVHTTRRFGRFTAPTLRRFSRAVLRSAALVGLALAVASPAAQAETATLKIGYSPIAEFLPAFVAKDQGIFEKHGLNVEFVSVALNSNIPAALMSRSVEIGGPNVAVFLQAVDGGLDLVAVSGITQIPTKNAPIAFVVREDVPYTGAKSIEGRKIVMPGIGSSVDVLFRQWMRKEGADPAKVTYVELPSVQINDVLRAKSVDGAVVVQPFLTRVLQDKNGKVAAHFTDILTSNVPAIIFAAQRSWAEKNPKLLAAFQASIKEGAEFAKANPEKARATIGTYIKLPKPVLDSLPSPTMKAELTAADLAFWIDAMKSEKFLKTDLKPAALIAR